MTVRITRIHRDRIAAGAMPELREKARRIVIAANRNTSAPAGITFEEKDDHILIGPTGAAGLPVEIGTRWMTPRRYFKRALDAERSK